MYLEAIILGFIIGLIRRGNFANFFNTRFRGWYIIFLALLLFAFPYGLTLFNIAPSYAALFPYLGLVTCALIALLNIKKRGFKLLLLGLLLNITIMGMNQFQMPVDIDKMSNLGMDSFVTSVQSGQVVNYTVLQGTSGYSLLLAKVIQLPTFYPLATVVSIGDVIASVAVMLIVQSSMVIVQRSMMLQLSYRPGKSR